MKIQRPATGPGGASWSILDPSRYRERFGFAFALSLYLHGLILFLQFGASGFGLPGFAWPWAERRVQAPRLTVRLVEVPRPPPPPASEPVRLRGATSLELRAPKVASAVPPPSAPLSLPQRESRAATPAAKARARDRKIQAKPLPQVLAQTDPQQETFKVPPPRPPEPEQQRAPESAAKKQTEEPPAAMQAEQAARRQAEEAARVEAEEARERAEEDARQRKLALQKESEAKKQEEAQRLEEAKKQEEARRLALEVQARKLAEETARQKSEELAREQAVALQKEQEAKKLEEARRIEEARKQEELKKQEEAKRLALEVEALKRAEEAARQQAAARQKELEARRQAEEAAARARELAERQRLEGEAAAQRERERLAAQKAPAPTPGALPGKELAAKALDQLRSARVNPPPPAENPRRRALIGAERDVPLRMYVESWRWKVERNGALNYRPSASSRASENPIVTVSIRSDGSLEDVLIHRSSGVRELDEAVRRIARLQAPYSAFPPALARQYDVLEIRRVWSFDGTLKILDEM